MINESIYNFGVAKSAIRAIAAYAAERKAELGDPSKVYDFSLGNPSVPAPAAVTESIKKCLEMSPVELHGYTPASGLYSTRKAIADSLEQRFSAEMGAQVATPEDLFITCGAAAAVSLTLRAVTNPGDEVIVIAPYFPEYRVWIENCGCTCVEVMADTETFQIDTEAVSRAITDKTAAVIIDSPNNPTGAIYTRENLIALADVLRWRSGEIGHPIYLISDEPYREITYGKEVPWVPGIYMRTIVCYSYSKSLSLAGERLGWILVPPTNPDRESLNAAVAGAARAFGYTCAPSLTQRVVADCVNEPADVASYAENRKALTEGMDKAGYTYVQPDGAFYLWVKALEPDAEAFLERCKAHELLPVPSNSFGCEGWIRIGYCVSHDTIVNSLPAWEALAAEYK